MNPPQNRSSSWSTTTLLRLLLAGCGGQGRAGHGRYARRRPRRPGTGSRSRGRSGSHASAYDPMEQRTLTVDDRTPAQGDGHGRAGRPCRPGRRRRAGVAEDPLALARLVTLATSVRPGGAGQAGGLRRRGRGFGGALRLDDACDRATGGRRPDRTVPVVNGFASDYGLGRVSKGALARSLLRVGRRRRGRRSRACRSGWPVRAIA